MSRRGLLITFAFLLGVIVGLFYLQDKLEKNLSYENISFNSLKEEANKYKTLKSLDRTKSDLQKTIQKLSQIYKPSSIRWRQNKVKLYFNYLPKNSIDRIVQTFTKKGHFIEEFKVKKSGDKMYLELGVNP